jgi:Mce-associated membrane protein
VEDQPTDPGDLTTDAAEADKVASPRRRHRWPLLKERMATQEAGAMTDAAPEEISESSAVVVKPSVDADVTATKRPRRWRLLRRRSTTQPPAAADETPATTELTPAPRTPVGKAARASKETEPDATGDDEPADEAPGTESESEPGESTAEDEAILVPHKQAGRRLQIAAAAAAVLFVAAGAFAGATVQPLLTDRALVQTKLDIAHTAANAITTLWTYTPDNMDSLADRSARYLTGDFASEYRKYIDAIVPTNKQAQVTNNTQVLGAAVETVTPSEATAVVYTNSVATSPVTKNIPSLRYLSYRLTMERDNQQWRITRMSTVTALDLTPKL